MISASKLPLLMMCAYPARPDVVVPYLPSGPAAKRGTARHRVYEAIVNGATITAEDMADGEIDGAHVRRFATWWESTGWGDCQPIAEQPFAFDPLTGKSRALVRGSHRAYAGVGKHELCGTADVVALDGRTAVAIDFKTGRAANVASADVNEQIRALTSWAWECAAVLWTLAGPIVEGISVIAHVLDDGSVDVTQSDIDAEQHEQILSDLTALHGVAQTAEPRSGSHCRDMWCPLLGRGCPAGEAGIAPVRAAVAERRALPPVPCPSTPDEAAALVAALPHLEAWVGAARAAAERYADEHNGIPLPSGAVWMQVATSRETVTATPAAIDVLRAELNGHADEALSQTTSKAAITRACKAAGVDPRKVLDTLREVGAIRTGESMSYRETTYR